jgi:hypothetical protein
MFPNDRTTKNRSKEWFALESIVCDGIIDRQSSPNPHTLAIYSKFVPAHGAVSERFQECQCQNDNVHLHYQTWVPGDDHYHCL